MEPTTISGLPDGRFTLATDPMRALSEDELREELRRTIAREDIVEDVVFRAMQMR